MSNKITLTPGTFSTGKTHRDTFFAKEEEGRYYIGHYHGETHDIHEVIISKEFYDAFIQESERYKAKYTKITES